jgi:hypothetical protein
VVLDTYASLVHYAEHLAPIWQALEPAHRGGAFAPRPGCWWGQSVPRMDQRRPVLVAAGADALKLRRHRLVYVEHGAGQTYPGDPRGLGNGSYSGGADLDHVGLFVCPSEAVAARWRARYPDAEVAVVGCPKLDAWHARPSPAPSPNRPGPVVALTFHWDCPLVPETRSALGHHLPGLAKLVREVRAAGGRVIGHGHPRAQADLAPLWRRLEVPHEPRLSSVLDKADLLVGDNTSALPEFASLGRPVLWLNAPWYRRDVHHGGRFWQWPEGQVQADHPDELVDAVRLALEDPPQVADARARMVHQVYAHTDGLAAERAAGAIAAWLERAA